MCSRCRPSYYVSSHNHGAVRVSTAQQQRFFSQAPPQKSQRRGNKADRGPLMNERLVKFLIEKSASPDAHGITVRFVQQHGDEKAKTEMVSLMRAVEVSTELGIDLIGINVEQDPPIIKALDYAKSMYKSEKTSKKSSSKATKEFKFKGTIADNDMLRKASDVIKYLKKGHNCQLTILSNAYARRKDPNCVENILKKLQEEVGDAAITGRIKTNAEKTNATIMLQPRKK
jgi:translation initiation factor IF-3